MADRDKTSRVSGRDELVAQGEIRDHETAQEHLVSGDFVSLGWAAQKAVGDHQSPAGPQEPKRFPEEPALIHGVTRALDRPDHVEAHVRKPGTLVIADVNCDAVANALPT